MPYILTKTITGKTGKTYPLYYQRGTTVAVCTMDITEAKTFYLKKSATDARQALSKTWQVVEHQATD